MKPINVSYKYNSNSLAAVLHINKSDAAGNSKRLYTPELQWTATHCDHVSR